MSMIDPHLPATRQAGMLYGGFRVARLPGQATCVAHAIRLWVEKNPVPPPNRRALDWSVVLIVERLCPIDSRNNTVVSNTHNWPEFYPGLARVWNRLC